MKKAIYCIVVLLILTCGMVYADVAIPEPDMPRPTESNSMLFVFIALAIVFVSCIVTVLVNKKNSK